MRTRSLPRRGAAVLTVVVVAAAAGLLALVLVRQVSLSSRASAIQGISSEARAAAADLIDEAVAQMAGDLTFPLQEVLAGEQDRRCELGPDAGSAFAAGDAWPASCGAVWSYAEVDPGAVGMLRVSHGVDGGWQLDAVVRDRLVMTGASRTVSPATAGGYKLWVDGNLALGDLTDGVTDGNGLTVDGVLYASDQVELATVTAAPGTVVAAENGFVGAATDPDARYFSSTPDPAGSPPVGDIRDIVAHATNELTLAGPIGTTFDVACPNDAIDADPADGDAGFVDPPAGTPPFSRPGHLCLRPGASFRDTTNGLVAIPAGTAAVLLTSTAADTVTVHTSPVVPGNCVTATGACDPYAAGAPASHPARDPLDGGTFWTTAGTASLPVSGVIGVHDLTAVVGACGSSFTAATPGTNDCQVFTVDAAGGGTTPVTIVAGHAAAPSDVIVGAPTRGVALVAGGDIVVAPWAGGAGDDVALEGPAVAGGAFRAAPADRGAGANAAALAVPGGIVAPAIHDLLAYTRLDVTGTAATGPWTPGPRAGTVPTPLRQIPLDDICADLSVCTTWQALVP